MRHTEDKINLIRNGPKSRSRMHMFTWLPWHFSSHLLQSLASTHFCPPLSKDLGECICEKITHGSLLTDLQLCFFKGQLYDNSSLYLWSNISCDPSVLLGQDAAESLVPAHLCGSSHSWLPYLCGNSQHYSWIHCHVHSLHR